MTRSRRTARGVCPQVEALEARDQPSVLPFTSLDAAPWLGLDFSLWEQRQAPETLARLRGLLTQAQETPAAAATAAVQHGNSPPLSTASGTATIAVAADRALLLAASTAAPSAEPQFATVVIETSEDGLANPQPGYRSIVTNGIGTRSGPDIQYSTYLGLENAEQINAVQIDAAGNIYLAGTIDSGDPDQGFEAFAGIMDSTRQLIYFNLFGGLGPDSANGIDFDAEGNVYVSGSFVNQFGTLNGFVAKLTADLSEFVWRRNVAGMPVPEGPEISFGNLRYFAPTNQVYYSGYLTTVVKGEVVKAGGLGRMSAVNGGSGVAITGWRFAPPNQGDSVPAGIGVDAAGNGYVALGATRSQVGDTFWWVFRARPNPGDPGFAPQHDWFQTYIADGQGAPLALWVDAAGNSYAVGAFSTAEGSELGVMKHSPTGQRLYRFSTPLIEGSTITEARAVTVDALGRIYVTGNFLTANGDEDVFLARITARQVGGGFEFDVDTLTFGGSGNERGLALAAQLDPKLPTYAVIGGVTNSDADFPLTEDAYQPFYYGGDSDGFVSRTRLPGA